MSERQTIALSSKQSRIYAKECIDQVPDDFVCVIRKKTRSLDQNAKLWAMLSDISDQVEWYGRRLTSEEWKHVFSASLKKQDVVPGIDGGFVVLGQSTSKMTIPEMRDLIELMNAFGAEKGVRFKENRYEGLYHIEGRFVS